MGLSSSCSHTRILSRILSFGEDPENDGGGGGGGGGYRVCYGPEGVACSLGGSG